MTSIDERARRAGDDLRSWDPHLPEGQPSAAIGRTRRRRRATRVAAGGVMAAAVLAVGVWQAEVHERGSVETRPAGRDEPRPTTTGEDPDVTPVPSTAPTASSATTALPTPPPPAPPAQPTTCTGTLSDGRRFVVDLPDGWYANDAFEGMPACSRFGPVPLEFFDYVEDWGWASNHDVTLTLTPGSLPPGTTWEESLEPHPNEYSGPITPEYTTIAGEAAVREDRVDPQNGGRRWVRWKFLIGDDHGYASAGEESPNGTPYETALAALDSIVHSIRIEG